MIRFAPRLLAACAFMLLAHAASAQERHPWITDNPRLEKNAWFSNLASGDIVTSPFVVRFGLTGIGIAAVKQAVQGTGHHHLLIDRDLPLDFTEPLPFTDQYVHFGKGQMEAILDLPDGEHTLRLVFADHRHIPNFVYSDVLRIRVQGRSARSVEALKRREVSVLAPAADATVRPPFALALHAAGFNVSHTAITEPDTGHFRVRLEPATGEPVVFDLTGGDTELWLSPPAGAYRVSVALVDNRVPGQVLAQSATTGFTVLER